MTTEEIKLFSGHQDSTVAIVVSIDEGIDIAVFAQCFVLRSNLLRELVKYVDSTCFFLDHDILQQ